MKKYIFIIATLFVINVSAQNYDAGFSRPIISLITNLHPYKQVKEC